MSDTKIRKEVSLEKTVVDRLKSLAKQEGRSLKNYMEKTLTESAISNKGFTTISEKKLEVLWKKYEEGEMEFISEEEFRNNIRRK